MHSALCMCSAGPSTVNFRAMLEGIWGADRLRPQLLPAHLPAGPCPAARVLCQQLGLLQLAEGVSVSSRLRAAVPVPAGISEGRGGSRARWLCLGCCGGQRGPKVPSQCRFSFLSSPESIDSQLLFHSLSPFVFQGGKKSGKGAGG